MNLFTISEFTKALSISKSTVSSWINRDRKIVIDSDRKIDIDNPVNKIQLLALKAKGKVFDFNKIYNEDKPIKGNSNDNTKTPIIPDLSEEYSEVTSEEVADIYEMSTEELYKEKLKLEVIRLKNQDKLDTLKIHKIEGALIPLDAVIHLFTNALSTYHTSYKRGIDSLLNEFKTRLEMSHDDTVLLKQSLHSALGVIQDSAKEKLTKGAEKVVDDYTEVRGRGERR